MKKVIASMISVCLIMSCVAVSAEVKVSSWAKDVVEQAHKMEIIPEDMIKSADYTVKINRIRFAELIYNVFSLTGKIPAVKEASPFTDTDNEYVSALYKDGIIYGKDSDSFAPSDNLTREEASTIFGRAIDKYCTFEFETDDIAFEDDKSIHDWARGFVYKMKNAGLIKGFEDNTFRPFDNMSEEEAVAIAVRAMETLGIKVSVDSTETPKPTNAPVSGNVGGLAGGSTGTSTGSTSVAATESPSETSAPLPSVPSTEKEPDEEEILDYIEKLEEDGPPEVVTEGENLPGSDLMVGENDPAPSQEELLEAEREMFEGLPTLEEIERMQQLEE